MKKMALFMLVFMWSAESLACAISVSDGIVGNLKSSFKHYDVVFEGSAQKIESRKVSIGVEVVGGVEYDAYESVDFVHFNVEKYYKGGSKSKLVVKNIVDSSCSVKIKSNQNYIVFSKQNENGSLEIVGSVFLSGTDKGNTVKQELSQLSGIISN